MTKIGASFPKDYWLQEEEGSKLYFPKRGAKVFLKGKSIGSIGVLHPEVIANFHLKFPVTSFEISLEEVFDHFRDSS